MSGRFFRLLRSALSFLFLSFRSSLDYGHSARQSGLRNRLPVTWSWHEELVGELFNTLAESPSLLRFKRAGHH